MKSSLIDAPRASKFVRWLQDLEGPILALFNLQPSLLSYEERRIKMFNKPTSFSQDNMFSKCNRCWFFKYVVKLETHDDMCYADAGNVIHKCMQEHYTNGSSEAVVRELFDSKWKHYKIDDSKIFDKKDKYWNMVVNGINIKVDVTTTELKIFYPDVVGYLDVVNTATDEISDWKSSTRRPENEMEYIHQLKFYSYLYFRKFKRLPTKATVYYLKYNGDDGVLEFIPTMDDVDEMSNWHLNIRKGMNEIIESKKIPDCVDECMMFCPFKDVCKNYGVEKK